jgi:hypothetical protein
MDHRRSLVIAGAAAVLLTGLVTMDDDKGPALVAPFAESPGLVRAASSSVAPAPRFEAANAGMQAFPISTPVLAAPATNDEAVLRLSVSAPAFVDPGSPQELVVGIPAPGGARWVELTISADPGVLELRAATRGEWDSGVSPAADFDARIDPVENRIALRVDTGGELSGNEAPGVVIVRFEGVAPGSGTVTVSGVAVGDSASAATPIASASARVVVMSGPI